MILSKIIITLLPVLQLLETGSFVNGTIDGPLQITEIYVKEANRIVGREKYSLEDRQSRFISYQIAYTVLMHQVPRCKDIMAMDNLLDKVEAISLLWNAGIRGRLDPSDQQLDYAERALNIFEDLINEE